MNHSSGSTTNTTPFGSTDSIKLRTTCVVGSSPQVKDEDVSHPRGTPNFGSVEVETAHDVDFMGPSTPCEEDNPRTPSRPSTPKRSTHSRNYTNAQKNQKKADESPGGAKLVRNEATSNDTNNRDCLVKSVIEVMFEEWKNNESLRAK